MVRIRTYTSSREVEQLGPLWKSIHQNGRGTLFQSFALNLLAARQFGHREEPFVVSAESSYGVAIVPAVRRRSDGSLRLLGEELFDYRGFLCDGDESVLRFALAALAEAGDKFESIAVRECDRQAVMDELELLPFTASPSVNRRQISAQEFGSRHTRLARNLRRLRRQGFDLKIHSGGNSALVRLIYECKASVDPASLFHDPLRVEFMVEAARLPASRCEIFTLDAGSQLAAALVIFREEGIRRFYTCFFSANLARLSPAMALIHEATRQSLADGLDCDYMTGEQGYKLRLATDSMPLYRLRATSQQLEALTRKKAVLRRAG